jgi:hypothetical protein
VHDERIQRPADGKILVKEDITSQKDLAKAVIDRAGKVQELIESGPEDPSEPYETPSWQLGELADILSYYLRRDDLSDELRTHYKGLWTEIKTAQGELDDRHPDRVIQWMEDIRQKEVELLDRLQNEEAAVIGGGLDQTPYTIAAQKLLKEIQKNPAHPRKEYADIIYDNIFKKKTHDDVIDSLLLDVSRFKRENEKQVDIAIRKAENTIKENGGRVDKSLKGWIQAKNDKVDWEYPDLRSFKYLWGIAPKRLTQKIQPKEYFSFIPRSLTPQKIFDELCQFWRGFGNLYPQIRELSRSTNDLITFKTPLSGCEENQTP